MRDPAVEKTPSGFQFVRKNKSANTKAASSLRAISGTRKATANAKAAGRRRSSVARGRSARRSLLEDELTPQDILVQFHEDVPAAMPATQRLEAVLGSCVEHALRDADPADLKSGGGVDMANAFTEMYIEQVRANGVLDRLAHKDDGPEAENAKMSPKERELTRQVAAYQTALSALEAEKQTWAELEGAGAKGGAVQVANADAGRTSGWQDAFLAGRLDVAALPEMITSTTERILLQIDQLHRNVMAVKGDCDAFAEVLDRKAEAMMSRGTGDGAAPATPRHTIKSILDPPPG